jgi:hypothetical protein
MASCPIASMSSLCQPTAALRNVIVTQRLVCPVPRVWAKTHQRLLAEWKRRGEQSDPPPIPLILAGWNFSSDYEKNHRWRQMEDWARAHDCQHLIPVLSEADGHFVAEFSSDNGVPDYLLSNSEPKRRPLPAEAEDALATLLQRWDYVAGSDLHRISKPLMFSGRKKRNLRVSVEPGHEAPWGTWRALDPAPSKRVAFTLLRKRINEVIGPHQVDHIMFIERALRR